MSDNMEKCHPLLALCEANDVFGVDSLDKLLDKQ